MRPSLIHKTLRTVLVMEISHGSEVYKMGLAIRRQFDSSTSQSDTSAFGSKTGARLVASGFSGASLFRLIR